MKVFLPIAIMLVSFVVLGQEVPGELSTALGLLGPFVAGFVLKYPWLSDVFGVMLVARVIMKPLMSAIIAMSNDSEIKFLAKLAAFSNNKIYIIVAFVLDWVFSLKLPKKAK